MAGSFVSAQGAAPKMKHGRGHPGKESARQKTKPEYPITDSFASKTIPAFKARHFKTSNKTGWHTHPGQPPAGHMKPQTASPNRGSGKEHRAFKK